MNSELRDFKKKFFVEEYLIFESKYWNVSLRPMQTTFGSIVISLKRESNTLTKVGLEENKNFGEILFRVSQVNKKYLKTNFSNIFQLMLIDNHVHWHYFPRYEHNSVKNLKYDPLGWPNKLEDLSKSIVSDHASLKNIYYEMKKYYE